MAMPKNRMKSILRLARSIRLIFGSTRLRVAIPALFLLLPLIFGVAASWVIDMQMSEQRTTQVIAMLDDLRFSIVLIVIANSIIGLLLGLLLVYVLVRPIEKIQTMADQMAEGRFTERLDFDFSHDEVGIMGRSFNSMVDRLHEMFSERNIFMMERISGAILTLSLDGTVVSANAFACELLGVSEEELIGRDLIDLLEEQPANEPLSRRLEGCLKQGKSLFSVPVLLADRHSRVTPVSVSTTQLAAADGQTYSIVVNIRDLEKLREFYRTVNRTDRLAAIGTFAMGMAHEIRNPLGSIKGLTQLMLQDSEEDSERKRYGEVILREIKRLDKLLRELLAFSNPAGQSVETVDLRELIEQVHEVVHVQIEERFDSLPSVTKSLKSTAGVVLPRDKVFQALFNIIINAYEAAAEAKGQVRLKTYEGSPGKVRLTVENTGTTIPESMRDKIFEPFYTTKDNGTGLGLAIAYQILSYAGANIQLECQPDLVRFHVDFPLNPFGDAVIPPLGGQEEDEAAAARKS